jgi:hypothetical protein
MKVQLGVASLDTIDFKELVDCMAQHSAGDLPRTATRRELSVLRHPDRATRWIVLLDATLCEPLNDLNDRAASAHAAVPIVGARLKGEVWEAGPPPLASIVGDPLEDELTFTPFALASEPPLRMLMSPDAKRVVLAAHHAALDGRALLVVLESLLGTPPLGTPDAQLRDRSSTARPSIAALGRSFTYVASRLAQPSDAVAAQRALPEREARARLRVSSIDRPVTARLAAACVNALVAHNSLVGSPLRRCAISVGMRGSGTVGNVATYRRVEVDTSGNVELAVQRALTSHTEPREFDWFPRGATTILRPFVNRLSDTFLISNLGRHQSQEIEALAFYPVARGKSAISFGLVAAPDGSAYLTARARRLEREELHKILEAISMELSSRLPSS